MTAYDGSYTGSYARAFLSCLTGLLPKIGFVIQICLEISPEGDNL